MSLIKKISLVLHHGLLFFVTHLLQVFVCLKAFVFIFKCLVGESCFSFLQSSFDSARERVINWIQISNVFALGWPWLRRILMLSKMISNGYVTQHILVAFAGNKKMDSNGAEVLKNILLCSLNQEFYVKTAPNLRLD